MTDVVAAMDNVKTVFSLPETLLDLMEEFGMRGDDKSAKECLEAYLRVTGEEKGSVE